MNNLKKCPFCNEEILAEAKKCKHCKKILTETNNPHHATLKYKTIQEVPWYRTTFVAWASVILFPPLFVLQICTGDIYYVKNGELKTVGTFGKILGGIIALTIFINIIKGLLA